MRSCCGFLLFVFFTIALMRFYSNVICTWIFIKSVRNEILKCILASSSSFVIFGNRFGFGDSITSHKQHSKMFRRHVHTCDGKYNSVFDPKTSVHAQKKMYTHLQVYCQADDCPRLQYIITFFAFENPLKSNAQYCFIFCVNCFCYHEHKL